MKTVSLAEEESIGALEADLRVEVGAGDAVLLADGKDRLAINLNEDLLFILR